MTAIFIGFSLFYDFMRNNDFGVGVVHVKRQILTYFCDVISLLAQVLYCFIWQGIQRVFYQNILKVSLLQFF